MSLASAQARIDELEAERAQNQARESWGKGEAMCGRSGCRGAASCEVRGSLMTVPHHNRGAPQNVQRERCFGCL